jgi:hypothetical protein
MLMSGLFVCLSVWCMQMLMKQQQQEQQALQQQQQQQKQKRLAVAARFYQMLLLHKALVGWHKHAAIAAALSKLHPAVVAPGGSSIRGSSAPADAAAAMQMKAQQLLQRLAGKQQQQVPTAEPLATGTPSATSSRTKVLQASAQVAAPKTACLLQITTLQEQQSHQLQTHPSNAGACDVSELVPAQPAWPSRQGSAASGEHSDDSKGALQLAQQQIPAVTQEDVHIKTAELAASSAASSTAAVVSREASCKQMLQVLQADQPEGAAAGADASAAAGPEDAAEAATSADAVPAMFDEADTARSRQRCTQQGVSQQPGTRNVESDMPHERASAEWQGQAAMQEECLQQQQEAQQQQQEQQPEMTLPDVSTPDLQQPAAHEQHIAQQTHDSQHQAPQEQDTAQTGSNQLEISAQEQQQRQQQPTFRVGSVDRQQLQQKLRQLLAAEQRKQREEQRQEQQLAQQLAEQQHSLAGMHYNLTLARRLGLLPWVALVKLSRQQQQAAECWRDVRLTRTAMQTWRELLMQR